MSNWDYKILLAVTIISMIIILIPPAFADFEGMTPSNIWTNKDHYNEGDTVIIYGKVMTTNYGNGYPNLIDFKLSSSNSITFPNGTSITLNYDFGITNINSDGTFSKSFILSGNVYFGSGQYTINAWYPYSSASGFVPAGSSIFTVGNIVGTVNPFQIVLNQTTSGQRIFAITIPDSENKNYTTQVNNGNRYDAFRNIITRVTDPEGQVTYINSPQSIPNFVPLQCCNTMFGTWEIQTTWGDNISLVKINVPRPPPSIDVTFYSTCPGGLISETPSQAQMEAVNGCPNPFPSYAFGEGDEAVKFLVYVVNKTPDQLGFTYSLLDPNGNMVLSKNDVLIGKMGLNVGGSTIIANPSDNSPDVQTVSDFIKIPTNSFNLDGNYTIKIDYQGITKTAQFQFKGSPVATPTPSLLVNKFAQTIQVGDEPQGIVYDSVKGEIFVANSGNGNGNNTVSVINDATNTVVATIPVGTPAYVTYDSGKGEIFVVNYANTVVYVINDVTNTVIATIPVDYTGTVLHGIAYDSGKGEIFVGEIGSGRVTVINDATNTVVATIPVATPEDMTYDSARGEIFVVNGGDTKISVINDATNTVVATVPVGGQPNAVTYDSAKGEIFVTSTNAGGTGTVSVINDATNTVVATVPVGGQPNAVTYDSAKGEIFVTNSFANTVSVISDKTNTVIATVPVGLFPIGIAYDSGKGEIFVTNYSNNTVSIINDATNTIIIPPTNHVTSTVTTPQQPSQTTPPTTQTTPPSTAQSVTVITPTQQDIQNINQAKASQTIAAEVNVGVSQSTTTSIDNNVSVQTTSKTPDTLNVNVSASSQTGPKVIMFNLNATTINLQNLKDLGVMYDGKLIQPAANVDAILHAKSTDNPSFAIIITQSGVQVLVLVPHFSTHSITITNMSKIMTTTIPEFPFSILALIIAMFSIVLIPKIKQI